MHTETSHDETSGGKKPLPKTASSEQTSEQPSVVVHLYARIAKIHHKPLKRQRTTTSF